MAGAGTESAVAATPVEIGSVERASLQAEIEAPGRTVALVEQRLRAPFEGTLTDLKVVEGDAVRKGQRIGEIVSRDSEAALRGARIMARRASSPAERADAERALELAESNLVSSPLVCPARGRVTALSAAAGDRVGAGQVILAVAVADSVVFRADLAQETLHRVRPGQDVRLEVAGADAPLTGRVHGLLEAGDTSMLTVPVRIDFAAPRQVASSGLYGTARIAVETHEDVPTVPSAAVLRDDLAGTARLATVDAHDHLRWVDVETGLQDGGRVELVAPRLAVGSRVVVSGQIGLPDGTPLAVAP